MASQLIFIAIIGLITLLVIETYNYHVFIKKAEQFTKLAETIQEAFNIVGLDFVRITEALTSFDERTGNVERGLDIADKNDAILSIMIDVLVNAAGLDKEKFNRIGQLESLNTKK